MSEKYNGWTNYETWRINLEMFDGGEYAEYTADELESIVEDTINYTTQEGFARNLALHFISKVNWQEIADHYNDQSE